MLELTEKKIQDILRNKDEILQDIRDKRMKMYELMEDTDSAITSRALPTTNISLLPSGSGTKKDLGDVVLGYKKELSNRSKEIRKFLWELSEMEEEVIRIWSCFCALPNPYYGILKSLYVENQLYQAVEAEYGHAHKTFEKHRKKGLHMIVQYAHSDMSVGDLLRIQYKNLNRVQPPLKHAVEGQINIFDILEENRC